MSDRYFVEVGPEPARLRDDRTRSFVGTGVTLLDAPGLKAVTEVRVGGQLLPASRTQTVIIDASGATETEEVPLYRLIEGPRGTALQRSLVSNDGIWQAGETILVTGEWSAPKKSGAKE